MNSLINLRSIEKPRQLERISANSTAHSKMNAAALEKASKIRFISRFITQNAIGRVVHLGHCSHSIARDIKTAETNENMSLHPFTFDERDVFLKPVIKLTRKAHIEQTSNVASLALSIDVLSQTPSISASKKYLWNLFHSTQNFVIIYTTESHKKVYKTQTQEFWMTEFIRHYCPSWRLKAWFVNPNKSLTQTGTKNDNFSDLYIYAFQYIECILPPFPFLISAVIDL